MTQPSHAQHVPVLDGFRALSILAVLAAHMLPLGPSDWALNATSGYMGMSVFFALSGFLITRVLWDNQNVQSFFIRRFARIVPLTFLISLLYALGLEGRFDTFLATNLYVLNYWTEAIAPSVSPLWSLGVEMQFYLAIGLAVWLFGRQGLWLVPVAALVVLILRIDQQAFGRIATHVRVDEILSGAMLAVLWIARPQVFPVLARFFWPLTILWALSCWPPSGALGYARPYLSMGMIGAVMGMQSGWQVRVLSAGPLRYIAVISFALYVWHSPFRFGWFAGGDAWERYLIRRPLGIAATFALAHASTFYYEKFFTDWARRYTRPKETLAKESKA